MDAASRAHPRVAGQGDTAGDHRVLAHPDVDLDERRRGILEGDALEHQGSPLAIEHDTAEIGEIDARVDAPDLDRIRDGNGLDGVAAAPAGGDHVGQVVLALGVVGGETAERVEQALEPERPDPAVDLANQSLGARRVALLHDARDGAGLVANDAAVPVGLVELGGEDRGHRPPGPVVFEQPADGTGLEQWHVPVEHHDRARAPRKVPLGLQQRVPGAQLWSLHDEPKSRVSGERAGDGVRFVADDESGRGGVEPRGGPDDVLDEWAPRKRMQHLRHRRTHACALAGGENDDVQFRHG